jgi:hypothetical protein
MAWREVSVAYYYSISTQVQKTYFVFTQVQEPYCTRVYPKVSVLSHNEINNNNNNNKHPLRSNTKCYGGKTHYNDSQNSDTTAPSGRELYHLQFSLKAASPETSGYTLVCSHRCKKRAVRSHRCKKHIICWHMCKKYTVCSDRCKKCTVYSHGCKKQLNFLDWTLNQSKADNIDPIHAAKSVLKEEHDFIGKFLRSWAYKTKECLERCLLEFIWERTFLS